MQIPKRSAHCFIDEKKWLPADEYVSYVFLNEDVWFREDYCLACWKNLHKEKELSIRSFFWRAKVPLSLPKKEPLAVYKALDLLMAMTDPINQNAADAKMLYILALFLERKRKIYKRQEVKSIGFSLLPTTLIYELPEKGIVFSVPALLLTENEMHTLYEELTLRLRAQ